MQGDRYSAGTDRSGEAEASPAPPKPPSEASLGHRPLVLVVEDSATMCRHLCTLLEAEYDTAVAENGLTALQLIQKRAPSVIVSDLVMPVLDGKRLVAQLKSDERFRHIPFILITTRDNTSSRVQGLDGGADDFLVKPFDSKEFLARVRAAVRAHRLYQELSEQKRELERVKESLEAEIAYRERMEADLRLAQKLEAIGQLADGIAHEINTPIQFVGDNLRFLKDSFGDLMQLADRYGQLIDQSRGGVATPQVLAQHEKALAQADLAFLQQDLPKAVEQSLEGVDRVATIVRSMKDFSHPGSEEMAACNLNDAIRTTVTVAQNEWKYVADVKTDLDPELPTVPCLLGEFNQAVLNIIINAVHAISDVVGDGADKKGTITITTNHDDQWAEIRIGDTGNGIPEEIQHRLFDPFFTTKDVGKGTGQGLAIARNVIVDKHKGRLEFETAQGRGTTFVIKLPLYVRAQAA